jgi:hypothetical protein
MLLHLEAQGGRNQVPNFISSNIIFGVNLILCWNIFSYMGYKIVTTVNNMENSVSRQTGVSEAIQQIRCRYIPVIVEGYVLAICTALLAGWPETTSVQITILQVWNVLTGVQVSSHLYLVLKYVPLMTKFLDESLKTKAEGGTFATTRFMYSLISSHRPITLSYFIPPVNIYIIRRG